jgi:hypothetical protein
MILAAGYVLAAGDHCPDHINRAKDYIRLHGLTGDDVKIMASHNGELLVITKKEIDFK